MSNHDDEHSGPSTLQPMVVIFGLILACVLLVALLIGKPVEGDVVPVVAKVEENIKPLATVEVAAATELHEEKNGADVVKVACAACHAAGVLNAPKIGDKGQWAPRIAQGYKTLVKHAIEGIRTMPARGGNMDLTDDEVASAVAEMANASGANFKFIKTDK